MPIFEATGDDISSINIRGDYNVIDSLKFTSGNLTIGSNAQYTVVQNNIFDGDPYDPPGDQINDGHLYLYDNTHYTVIRNNYFHSINAHAIKTYSSSNMPTNISILYNRFYTGSVSYGLVTFKSSINTYEIAYNRFEDVTSNCISIGSAYGTPHNGLNIHHNVFDNCSNSVFTKLNTGTTGPLTGLLFHDNVIYNAFYVD